MRYDQDSALGGDGFGYRDRDGGMRVRVISGLGAPGGELISLAAKFGSAPERGRHGFRTDDLKTHGRYVQRVARTSLFVFVDEIEIYAGQPQNGKASVAEPVVTNAVAYLGEHAAAGAEGFGDAGGVENEQKAESPTRQQRRHKIVFK